MHKQITSALERTNETMVNKHNTAVEDFQVGDLIYEKKILLGKTYKTESPFAGPFEILERRTGNKFVIKHLDTNEIKISHADRFKLFRKKDPQQDSAPVVRRSKRLQSKM